MPWYPDADEAMRRVRAAMQSDHAPLTPQQRLLQEQERLLQQKQFYSQQQRMRLEARNQAMHFASQIRSKRVSMRINEQQLAEFRAMPLDAVIALEIGNGNRVTLDETLRVMQALGLQLSTFPQW